LPASKTWRFAYLASIVGGRSRSDVGNQTHCLPFLNIKKTNPAYTETRREDKQ
jgi:hypothetical protein